MVNLIIPIYKGRDTIEKGLFSLLAQTKDLFMITMVQDCDGEDYSDIIEKFTNLGLHINLLQTPENVGPGMARQYAIDRSDAFDYVMFMDADDELFPRAVEQLYREAKLTDADILVGNMIAENADKTALKVDSRISPVTWMHGKIYKTQFLKKYNIRFKECLTRNEDSYFNLVAFGCAERAPRLNESVYLWRNNVNSLTRSKKTLEQKIDDQTMFFMSQYYGICDIYKKKGTINCRTLVATIINLYNCYENLLYYGTIPEIVQEVLAQFKDINFIQETLMNNNIVPIIFERYSCIGEIDDKFYLYRESFGEWAHKFIFRPEINYGFVH